MPILQFPRHQLCAVCGKDDLRRRWAVADGSGPWDMTPATDQYGRAPAAIARCARCGHLQVERMPAATDLAHAYEEIAPSDSLAEEAGERATARGALARIERFTGGPGAVVDLGCWTGSLLAEARARGWRALGVEPSAPAAQRARARAGVDVVQGGVLDAAVPAGEWDAVVLGDVLEHIADPAAALDRVRGLLRAGGVVHIATPDAGSRVARVLGRRWWSVLPTHVHYFTRGSLATLLERRGFEIVSVRTAPKTFSVGYYLGRVGGYSRPLAEALVRAARTAGVADRLWTPDFRDRMAVIARPR